MPSLYFHDNKHKAKHGANARESLLKTLEDLLNYGAIESYWHNPSYGYDGYDPHQFDAHEEVTYPDGSKAILYATSSLRSDRIETNQWRAHNIKCIDPLITKAFVILPDESGFDKGTAVRDKIRDKQVISAIDDILTLQEFYTATINTFGATIESGARHALQGVKLEELFASILADPQNLRRYNGNSLETGYMYDVFCQVLETLGIAKGSVAHITATTKIPSLPSGGNPKTDVAATFTFTDGETIQPTFSLKNTSRRSVSVHEYAADTFADVLDPTNTELRRLLNVFQTCGNKRDMNPDDIEALTMVLKPYLNKLNHWVFAGEGAQGTSSIQIADYLVTHDKETDTFAIHTVEDYCNKLTREIDGSKWFGTIFSWTYPSKKRRKKIQLKAPIIQ